jgi:hypothetical protein
MGSSRLLDSYLVSIIYAGIDTGFFAKGGRTSMLSVLRA